MLIRNITEKIAIAHESEQWMVLRKLTGRQVRAARERVADNALDKMKRMGGDVVKSINEIVAPAAKTDAATDAAAVDPLKGYDLDLLLKYGIANWSYVDDKSNEPMPVNDDNIALLDSETERWAALEILRISGVNQTESDRKNG